MKSLGYLTKMYQTSPGLGLNTCHFCWHSFSTVLFSSAVRRYRVATLLPSRPPRTCAEVQGRCCNLSMLVNLRWRGHSPILPHGISVPCVCGNTLCLFYPWPKRVASSLSVFLNLAHLQNTWVTFLIDEILCIGVS